MEDRCIPRQSRCRGRFSLKALLKIKAVAGFVTFIALAGINAHADGISFVVNWICETPGSCTAAEDSAAASLGIAANIWGGLLDSNYAGETITIDAFFDTSSSLPSGALAAGSPVRAEYEGVPIAYNYFYPSATGNHLAGYDLHPGEAEIQIKYAPRSDWYYYVDTNQTPNVPSSYYDFVTTSIHEITHGLGFTSALDSSMQYPFSLPSTHPTCPLCGTGWYYDAYVFNETANDWVIHAAQGSRLAMVTDPGNLVFTGGYAFQELGAYPVLYSPPLSAGGFVEGSSVSHLSENPTYGYPGDLMNPHAHTGVYNHTPSALDLAMLKDVGWIPYPISAIPEPGSLLLLGTGVGILLLAGYRRKNK